METDPQKTDMLPWLGCVWCPTQLCNAQSNYELNEIVHEIMETLPSQLREKNAKAMFLLTAFLKRNSSAKTSKGEKLKVGWVAQIV